MAKRADWVIGIIVLIVISSVVFVGVRFLFLDRKDDTGPMFAIGGSVAVVEINGVIYDSYDRVQELKKWHKRRDVKALVIRLNSPGGGAAASHEIFEQVKKIREDGIPVIISMGTIAASGAYYVACAGDEIYANPETLTGSLGVVIEFPVADELLRKIGLSFETIISGNYKDSGNPAREMRKDEREYFQGIVDDSYEVFVGVIAEGRNLSIEEVKKVADGRVYTGNQAMELGLIDKIGTYEDAIYRAKELSGLDPDAPVRKTPRKDFSLFSLFTSDIRSLLSELSNVPVTQYIMQ